MPAPPTDPPKSLSATRARIGLLLVTLLSVGPPACHYFAIVPTIDSARINGGLLPGPLVVLRIFGPASAFLAFIILAALVASCIRADFAAPLLHRCSAVLLAFGVAYLCYALLVIMFLFATSAAADINSDYITPSFTFSPDHRYDVMIPVFHIEAAQEPDHRMNKVVELRTRRIVAVIRGEPGYDRALNFHETAPPLWSADSSILLWKVKGKWFPDALVLLKLEQGKERWQLDLLRTAQRAILSRTKNAAPERYAAAKEANAGNGSAYPDGFTVDVTTDEDKIAFPYHVLADLTANPKKIEDFPANLESHLDAVVTEDGKFIVKDFKLEARFQ